MEWFSMNYFICSLHDIIVNVRIIVQMRFVQSYMQVKCFQKDVGLLEWAWFRACFLTNRLKNAHPHPRVVCLSVLDILVHIRSFYICSSHCKDVYITWSLGNLYVRYVVDKSTMKLMIFFSYKKEDLCIYLFWWKEK